MLRALESILASVERRAHLPLAALAHLNGCAVAGRTRQIELLGTEAARG